MPRFYYEVMRLLEAIVALYILTLLSNAFNAHNIWLGKTIWLTSLQYNGGYAVCLVLIVIDLYAGTRSLWRIYKVGLKLLDSSLYQNYRFSLMANYTEVAEVNQCK